MKKSVLIVIQVILAAVIVVLAYFCYDSIKVPQEFKKIKEYRYDLVIQVLKDIRSAEEAYNMTYDCYTSNFDTLINFVKYDSVKNVKSIGELTDEQIEAGMTELEAIRKGFILRDTVRTATLEYLTRTEVGVNGKPVVYEFNTNPDDLRWIPTTGKTKQFHLEARVMITDRGSEIPLFEARASDRTIFADLFGTKYENPLLDAMYQDQQLGRYVGLKVGDVNEPNGNVGNWQ